MAPEQSANFFECSPFAIDIVVGGIVFVGSSGNIELAVGYDFVVISLLTQRRRGRGHRAAEHKSLGKTQTALNTQYYFKKTKHCTSKITSY